MTRSSSGSRGSRYNNNNAGAGGVAGAAGVAGLAGGMLGSGAGGTTTTSCPPEDKSFYCQFVHGFNILKMLFVIIAFLFILWIFWKAFSGGSKRRR